MSVELKCKQNTDQTNSEANQSNNTSDLKSTILILEEINKQIESFPPLPKPNQLISNYFSKLKIEVDKTYTDFVIADDNLKFIPFDNSQKKYKKAYRPLT